MATASSEPIAPGAGGKRQVATRGFLELDRVVRTLKGMEAYCARDDAELWRAAGVDPEAFGEL